MLNSLLGTEQGGIQQIFSNYFGNVAPAVNSGISNPSSVPGLGGLLNFPQTMQPQIQQTGNQLASANKSGADTLMSRIGGTANPNALATDLRTNADQSARQGTQVLGAQLGSEGLNALSTAGNQFLSLLGIGTQPLSSAFAGANAGANLSSADKFSSQQSAQQQQAGNANMIGNLFSMIFGL